MNERPSGLQLASVAHTLPGYCPLKGLLKYVSRRLPVPSAFITHQSVPPLVSWLLIHTIRVPSGEYAACSLYCEVVNCAVIVPLASCSTYTWVAQTDWPPALLVNRR